MCNPSIRRKFLLGAAVLLAVAGTVAEGLGGAFHLHAQLLFATGNPPSFEVATIKPSPLGSGLTNFSMSATRFGAENATLKELIRLAYNINSDDQLGKGPDWMSSEKFDIDAKIGDAEVDAIKKLPPDQRLNQCRLMVQSLLADRFNLKVSTASKELPVLALVAAKDGLKLTQASAPSGTPVLYGGSRGDLNARAVTMKFFADFFLSGREDLGDRVVIDATGLRGSFDFTLKWSRDEANPALPSSASQSGGAASAPKDSSEPSLSTALREQLGLKLEPRKAVVEVLVIDHIERPSPN